MVHRDGEIAAARAARDAGTVFMLTGGSSFPARDVIAQAPGHVWCQLYMRPRARDTEIVLDEAIGAGCRVLCVTVDGSVQIARDRDFRNRVTVPLRRSPRVIVGGLRDPRWLHDFLRGRVARGPACRRIESDYWRLATTVAHNKSVTLDDLQWLRSRWPGRLLVKGILRSEECRSLIECGVDGVIVSNHGGRLLDGTPATIEALPEIVAAVGDDAEVLLDGGVRHGTDVVKALALGARACLIGRPYLWGLARGQQGVRDVLGILARETEQAMALLGCAGIDEIDSTMARVVA
jgi:isopentenyl diphosphate isomerase/L-lactate dehydrogenase-like FMN-dependent dehydrogenase